MEPEQDTSMVEESSFYPRTDAELDEISRSFKVNLEISQKILESFVKKLRSKGSSEEDFDDFRLATMTALDDLNIGLSLDEFLRRAYLGLSHVLLSLQSDEDLSEMGKRLPPHISDSSNIIRHFLQERSVVLPSLHSEAARYQRNTLDHLAHLTDIYLRSRPDYLKFKSYHDLIKDFQVISEIAEALQGLRVKFEELKRKPKQNVNDSLENEDRLSMFAEMERMRDLSGQ
jgi:hypothetical protein